MTSYPLTFDIQSTGKHNLDFSLLIDNALVYKGTTDNGNGTVHFDYDVANTDKHDLKIVISGKKRLIEEYNDSYTALHIKKLCIQDIDIMKFANCTYTHNQNSFGDNVVEHYDRKKGFPDVLGYDGELSISFFTPLAYWLIRDFPY